MHSLKGRLCIEGKKKLYNLCQKQHIPYRQTTKWLVAQDGGQFEQLEKTHRVAQELDIPTRFLSRKEIQENEPEVRAEAGVLHSTSTGIVDSHSLMSYLEGDFVDRGGDQVLNTKVVGIEPLGSAGYRIHTQAADSDEIIPIDVETVVNCAGLGAVRISNLLLPPERQQKAFYAKGTYFSYGSSFPRPKVLIYPAPVPGAGGLGTHLTLDMAGCVRFGPDVEWLDDPADLSVNASRLSDALAAIQQYLPNLDKMALNVDYCGIRPKLVGPEVEFCDFYIKEEEGFSGFINLLGIESPGLTASLAIGAKVRDMLYGNDK